MIDKISNSCVEFNCLCRKHWSPYSLPLLFAPQRIWLIQPVSENTSGKWMGVGIRSNIAFVIRGKGEM